MAARTAENPETLTPEPRAAFLSDDAIDIVEVIQEKEQEGVSEPPLR